MAGAEPHPGGLWHYRPVQTAQYLLALLTLNAGTGATCFACCSGRKRPLNPAAATGAAPIHAEYRRRQFCHQYQLVFTAAC
ncbi:hypothetical protein KCP74_23000 [Salmonella enterica subsp. enterica]|nr:hypothetical protein KCP74_23000 [Salmonella enterica subsp. enterica]